MSEVAPPRAGRSMRWIAVAGVQLLATAAISGSALAQEAADAWEFTRQGLLVAPLTAGEGVDAQTARRTTDRLRSQLNGLLPRREVELIRTDSVRARMTRAGFDPDSQVPTLALWQLSRSLRADEILSGTITRQAEGYRIQGEVLLSRDLRLRQPLPPSVGATLDAAVQALAEEVVAVRSQLVPQRRCENHLREGNYREAIRTAREGVSAYPNGALARTCLTRSLLYGGYPADQVLGEAEALLRIDPVSAHGLESAAMALDSLGRREAAAPMWLRLLATDSTNQELAERVAWALHENGNSAAAEPVIMQLTALNPSLARMLHLQWRIANVNRNWQLAVTTGEALLEHDVYVPLDSVFISRLATVYELNGDRFKAIATAARGVADMPDAVQLYAQYTRLIQMESDTALSRGLALFPRSAELLAMHAEALRAEGRLHEALVATRSAVAIDPTLPQGELTIAQAEFDLGQPDSSLASLRRIVSRANGGVAADSAAEVALADVGRDSTLTIVGQFALSKGNQLLRAADATKREDSFQLALSFLTLADSLLPSPQSKFLVGVAALGTANAALSDSPAAGAGSGGCETLREVSPMLNLSRDSFVAGRDVAPDAVDQYMGFLGRLDEFVQGQIRTTCPAS